jgi:hypothetical protein
MLTDIKPENYLNSYTSQFWCAMSVKSATSTVGRGQRLDAAMDHRKVR